MIAKSHRGMHNFLIIAQVYVDPGSGALLWQMLVAAAVGALYFLRKLIRFRK